MKNFVKIFCIIFDLNFSCRAETGYNIILIIHLLSASTLQEACSQNEDQLIVYELGETFGGYWGHLPDTMMMKKASSNYTKFYTIKTTQSTITERYLQFYYLFRLNKSYNSVN